jgi:hypothetical protein
MAVVWIRRKQASDILVRFDSITLAQDWGKHFLLSLQDPELRFCEPYDDPDCYLGVTSNLHVQWDYGANWSPKNWVGPGGIMRDSWNERGTVEVFPEEAVRLGALGEPEGFIPTEPTLISKDENADRYTWDRNHWKKNSRCESCGAYTNNND